MSRTGNDRVIVGERIKVPLPAALVQRDAVVVESEPNMKGGGVVPLTSYGVLTGQVLDRRAEGGADTPHYQIRVRGGDTEFRVAVNVLSQQSPPELLYVADEAFTHPQVQTLPDLPDGFTALPSQAGGLALDYIRGNLFDRQAMRPLPANAPGPDNDLADKLDHYLARAATDPTARLYAFGQRWDPSPVSRTRSSISPRATGYTTST